MPSVDSYKDEILDARGKGAPVTGIAKALGFAPSTIYHALDRWERPQEAKPGDEALEALRRLVKG